MSSMSATYQGRLALNSDQETFLSGYAGHYSYLERCLYADIQKSGTTAASFKNNYLVGYGITARQFNAIGINLEGKIKSVLKLLPLQKQNLQTRIAKLIKTLSKIKSPFKLHQKKRKLHILETKLIALEVQIKAQEPRICFGSRALFRKQFNLEENGYQDHQAWKTDWTASRNNMFYILGSKDETSGCQGCVLTANLDGTFNLKLRSLSKEASYLFLKNVSIPYGQDIIREAMRHPQALSYRFLRDEKGWRVFVTTNRPEFKSKSVKTSGVIGIDINQDCLTVSEINRHGNLINSWIVPLVTYGKTTDQAEAIIGNAVKTIVALAEKSLKPIVIEDLDFSKKKAALEAENPKYARMLSSLSYNKIIQNIRSKAYQAGIEVFDVNPAYTSTIGAVNYVARYGLSTHQAAALAIARRGMGFSEEPVKQPVIKVCNGGHVTFPVPARKPGKHVWTQWAAIRKNLQAALAAHIRSGGKKLPPGPLRLNTSVCPTWMLPVRSRHANHRQNCSAGVMDNIPW